MKNVLVTGSSTGIGLASTMYLAERGYHVFAGARKEADLEKLGEIANVTPLKLDVTIENDLQKVFNIIESEGLYALVNNAGIALPGPLMELTKADLQKQFDVNVFGLHEVTRWMFPLLSAQRGRIVNIGSIAGDIASPFLGAYSMSKFALEAYSDALRRELDPLGIKVSLIKPGTIKTPIWEKREVDPSRFEGSMFEDRLKKMERYLGKKGKYQGLPPEKVAKAVYHAIDSKKPKIRYLITENNFSHRVTRNLPDSFIDYFLRKRL